MAVVQLEINNLLKFQNLISEEKKLLYLFIVNLIF